MSSLKRLVEYIDCLHTAITLIVVGAAFKVVLISFFSIFLKTQKPDEVLKKGNNLLLLQFLSHGPHRFPLLMNLSAGLGQQTV